MEFAVCPDCMQIFERLPKKGRTYRCRECQAAATREAQRRYNRAYYVRHRAEILEKKKADYSKKVTQDASL